MVARLISRPALAALAGFVSVVACAGDPPIRQDGEAAVTSVFSVSADTYVDSGSPSANYGTSRELAVGNSPVRRSFLKFSVSGLTSPVASARLRLHVPRGIKSGSASGGSVARVTDIGWSEHAVTYANQPAIGASLATLGTVSANS